jgi:pimeloyl-ACP methyl ester carboxylesterase
VSLEVIQTRIHGATSLPTLIYLPGLHGDWTLVSSLRAALQGRARFIEFTYPRTTTWSLDDYARAVTAKLEERGIQRGWLIGESFSSQVAWKILEQGEGAVAGFQAQGLILAGGFVRHPLIWGVHGFHALHRRMPAWCFRGLLKAYGGYARLRHRRAPETRASVAEFLARRTEPDRAAIGARYPLIARHDPRPVARRVTVPVYALSGFFDPIVPWPFVYSWLHRHCPVFCGSRVIFNADHNVLGTAPVKSAEQILGWVRDSEAKGPGGIF